jgi:hypothetical protein
VTGGIASSDPRQRVGQYSTQRPQKVHRPAKYVHSTKHPTVSLKAIAAGEQT